jgi:crotonobetainyl-CoA:carnitine CoA-transferase CaiB-like acyl-CoA transferase
VIQIEKSASDPAESFGGLLDHHTGAVPCRGKPVMPFEPASDVLQPFTVLDLTRVRSGPTCVRQLADWGANVIRVETPGDTGQLGGPRSGSDFQNLHRNKRAIAIDLKNPKGLATFMRLVEKADVVVENYRPDVKHRLGVDYESLAAINPRIILASISGFGQDGPSSTRPGLDQIAQGLGGLMSITGEPGKGPMRVGIPIADLCAGILCSQGILLALIERVRSGKGQWVQTSLLQAQVFMLDFQAARWLMDREVPQQAGNDHPTTIPTGVFATSDGHINIASAGESLWIRLKELLGDPELDSPDFVDNKTRSKNRARLNAILAKHIETASSAAWIDRLNAAGVPCGEINTIDKVFADRQVQHLGMAADMVSRERGPSQIVGQGIRLSRSKWTVRRPPPGAAEHTREVLTEAGFSEGEIEALAADGAIQLGTVPKPAAARSTAAANSSARKTSNSSKRTRTPRS